MGHPEQFQGRTLVESSIPNEQSSGSTVGGIYGGQVQREMSQGAVSRGRARGAGALDDLQHHRLAVVAHRHLHAAQPLRRRRAARAARVPHPAGEKNVP